MSESLRGCSFFPNLPQPLVSSLEKARARLFQYASDFVGQQRSLYAGSFNQARIDRPQIFVICDVSRSVQNVSHFIDILQEIYGKCKKLLWLNPETPSIWGMGDSEMKAYLPYCHLAQECSTLNHLERVLDQVLRH